MKRRNINWKTAVAAVVLAGTIPLAIATVSKNTIYANLWMRVGNTTNMTGSLRTASIGQGNVVSSNQYSLAVGKYLTIYGDTSMVIGEYNESVTGGAYFVIGNGTDSEGKNLLEVTEDGQIIIREPQGNIPMGPYQ